MSTRHTSRRSQTSKDKSSKDKSGKSKSSKDKSGKSKSSKDKSRKSARHPKQDDNLLNLWCAIYHPREGNYYHWAFVVSNTANRDWDLFEVVQESTYGTFTPVHRKTNPMDSRRCLRPLTALGQMHRGWWETMAEGIRGVPIGEATSWNCQDYVIDIWDMLLSSGLISEETWCEGKTQMLPYYGQDFGGGGDGDDEDYDLEDDYEDDDNGEGGSQRFLSEAFVYDSDA